MRLPTNGYALRLSLFVLLLALLGCGSESVPAPEIAAAVPDLPEYVSGFDKRVLALLRESHRDLLADPQDPERWMKLGMVFEAHSEAAQAENCYVRALALRDDVAHWWYRLAMAREASDNIEGALEALDQTIALDASYAPAHWRRGGWKLEMGDTDEARKCFERALALDSTDPAALLGLVQVHIWRAENEQAVAALEGSSLLEGPNGPWAKRQLGTAYQRLGKTEQARVLLATTRTAKPHYRDPWKAEVNSFRRGMATINRQARSLIAAGAAPAAVALLKQAIKQEPEHIPILRTLGAAYAATGEMQKSHAALTAALRLDPENVELQVDATWGVALMGDLAGALHDVDKILARSPKCGKAHALRTQLLLDLGRGAEAQSAFEQATLCGHRDPLLRVNIGKALIQLERLEDALQSFSRAAQEDPGLQGAWIGQAICTLNLGRLEQASVALEHAEQLAAAQAGGDTEILAQIRSQLSSLQAASEPK